MLVAVLLASIASGCTSPQEPVAFELADHPAVGSPDAGSPDGNRTLVQSNPDLVEGAIRVIPSELHEYFRFVVEHPPAGNLTIRKEAKNIGQTGVHAFLTTVLTPSTGFQERVIGFATYDHAGIHSDAAPVTVSCCMAGAGSRGQGIAYLSIHEGTPWLDIWVLTSGWFPHDEAWFEVTLTREDGTVYGIPLAERGSATLVNLREEIRRQGSHVIVRGDTVLSTVHNVSVIVPSPLFAAFWASARKNDLAVQLRVGNAAPNATLLEGEETFAIVSSGEDPLEARLDVPGDNYSFSGLVLSCPCRPLRELRYWDGVWAAETDG